MTTHVLQLDPLQIPPHAFVRIQLWSVARQSFEMDAPSCSLCQEVLDRLTAVDRGAVPHDQQLPRNVPQHVLEQARHSWTFVRSLLHLHQQPPSWCERTDDRQLVIAQWHLQERRLAAWCLGPHERGQQIEPCFIYPDEGASFLFRFF